jgi:hypothetical protein
MPGVMYAQYTIMLSCILPAKHAYTITSKKKKKKNQLEIIKKAQRETIYIFSKHTCARDETIDISNMAALCLFNNHLVCWLPQTACIVMGNDHSHSSMANSCIVLMMYIMN